MSIVVMPVTLAECKPLKFEMKGQSLRLLNNFRTLCQDAYDMGRLTSVAFDVIDGGQIFWRLFAFLFSHLSQLG